MQDLNDLYFFAQVVEHGGFAAAARALDMPRSRLSRRIGQLEERLGVRLIHRSTRRFSVTEIGREYHRHCVAMLVEWYLEGPDGATAKVPHRPRFIVTDVAATRLAVLHGVGIAALPASAIEPDLRDGALVDVLPGWAPPAALVYAVFPSRRGLLPSGFCSIFWQPN